MSTPALNPSWMPFSVRDAIRSGEEAGADLASGAAWSALLESLQHAAAVVLSDRVPQNPVDTAAGFRHLLVLLHIAIEEIVRSGGTLDIKPANTDNAIKWGMDCPDCVYSGCAIRGDETYRITGNRGSARYVGLQANAGMSSTANLLLDEIETDENGDFTLTLSVERPNEGNWMPIAPEASALIIRQFFYDWDHEVPAVMRIERLTPSSAAYCSSLRHRTRRRNGPTTRRGGRVRRGEPRLLPRLRQPRHAEQLQSAVRWHRDGRRRRKPSSHRGMEAGVGRCA